MKKISETTTYTLNDAESKAYEKFKAKHHARCQATVGIAFVPTGIGIAAEVFCTVCHKSKDITDYSCW